MKKLDLILIAFSTSFTIMISSCNHKSNDASTPVLDTVSLSGKNFALAYQDGSKIVATSIDTMKQISFGGATHPAISPDGNKLAYTVTDSAGNKSIWVADLENKSQQQLHADSEQFDQASWSPDGQTIAYQIRVKNGWKIGTTKIDNTQNIIFDEQSKISYFAPTWKNNREIIAHDLTGLYTYAVTGKELSKQLISGLVNHQITISAVNPFFYSSDGKHIIFSAGNNEVLAGSDKPGTAIYILNLKSKAVKRISPQNTNTPDLFVTRDDRIFFSGSEKHSESSKIYISDLEGNIKVLVDKGTYPTAALK
ncbi:PD40 domain-containing protein [Pedobacter sp. BMA]|uniref:TolB family protein n=1 Tax=Pedobacter sp. BMA TaxID=1663685 RepID=UPI00064B4B4D|nr:PD40 domain-containing protein [Pedobacter sp. BMA]KLT64537.1 hypothetical protein AB669_12260 [Pedobacter sp. BMA]